MDKLARTESHGGRQRPPGSSRSSRLHVACAVSIAALTPSACGSTDEDSTQPATSTAASTTVAPVASASKNAQPTGIQAVRVAYEKLLADPAAARAQADAEYTPSSEDSFSYAIGEFTGDDRPEMLLRAGAHAANPVFVVSTDPNNTVVVARTIVRQGVNELGQDLQIRFSAAHDFIYQLTFDTIGSTTADTPPTSIDTGITNVARTGQAEARRSASCCSSSIHPSRSRPIPAMELRRSRPAMWSPRAIIGRSKVNTLPSLWKPRTPICLPPTTFLPRSRTCLIQRLSRTSAASRPACRRRQPRPRTQRCHARCGRLCFFIFTIARLLMRACAPWPSASDRHRTHNRDV